MEKYTYGSVYKVTREDAPRDIAADFRKIKDCGMNTVVIWPPVFYWEEKGPDYPFHTGLTILDIAEKNGLKVIMELAGQLSVFEYIPDYELKESYYAVDEKGHREWGQDSFGFLNYFHPEVKEKICTQFRSIARAYKSHPALYAYDIFNETMYHSFDPYTMEAFRSWLKQKYGTIGRLNQVWERTYTDFSQIRYEHHKWMSIMPKADYFAFRKAAVGIFLRDWCDAVREEDPDHILIADNIHSQVTLRGDYARPQDDYDLKNIVDEIGLSFYPKGVSGLFQAAERHQIFSGFADAARGEGFLVSEMQTHIQAIFNPTTAVKPHELKQWCYEAYASGAKALIYWMWRPFRKGLQTLGRGLVDHRARETRRFAMAREIGAVFCKFGPLSPACGKVGVLYDPLSEDFQYLFTEAYDVDQQIYLSSIYGAYKMMFDLNIPCDMIRMEEIGRYPAVILSNKIVMTAREARILAEYISNGGLCITDGKFGLVDETSMLFSQLPGGHAYPLCGQDLLDSACEGLDFTDEGSSVPGFYSRDLMNVTDGTVICAFSDGNPAMVKKQTGRGAMISINTFLFYGYARDGKDAQRACLKKLLDAYGISPVSTNPDVKVKFGTAQSRQLIIAFNYTDRPQETTVIRDGMHRTVYMPPNDAQILIWET